METKDANQVEPREQNRQLGGKYLTFQLGEEQFGLEILKVREIIGVLDVTKVPQTAAFVRGVINLRGKVIPVMDLRLRFGLPWREDDERTCTIVVEVGEADGHRRLMGIVVDQVREVVSVRDDDVENTPSFGVELDTAYILGMAKLEGGVKILLDIDRVVADSQLVIG
ncbi:MAG: chemotaxis protein CheW [Desulfarculus sp.]|nr:chemotaxis protein CheW [Desulfarculus sp.]